jgi:protein-disulfide isomerase
MAFLTARLVVPSIVLIGTAVLLAQDWQTATTLPMIDFTGLSAAKKTTALRLMRNYNCPCGCELKVAECRVKDPGCAISKGLGNVMVVALKEGRNESETIAAARESKFGEAPARPKLLEDPIVIPTAGSPELGPANAAVTLIEFSDFQCPYCFSGAAKLHAILKAFPTQVKLIFKQYPLDTHSQAAMAAAAAIAAHRQGKFWPLHDAMFANRRDLSRPAILALASKAGLEIKRFTADLDSPETRKAVIRDREDGDKAGITGTPTVFINGQHYNGSLDMEKLRPVIEAELQKPRTK